MSAPDFYFAINALFRHLHDRHGHGALIEYWRRLGTDYYARRTRTWKQGGVAAIADDWRAYFEREPQADVSVAVDDAYGAVDLNIRVCPAIKHLRDHARDIVPYFCEHCDHVCGAMAQHAGYRFERVGGMGACRQRFVPLTVSGK
jgi:hypothetical protein